MIENFKLKNFIFQTNKLPEIFEDDFKEFQNPSSISEMNEIFAFYKIPIYKKEDDIFEIFNALDLKFDSSLKEKVNKIKKLKEMEEFCDKKEIDLAKKVDSFKNQKIDFTIFEKIFEKMFDKIIEKNFDKNSDKNSDGLNDKNSLKKNDKKLLIDQNDKKLLIDQKDNKFVNDQNDNKFINDKNDKKLFVDQKIFIDQLHTLSAEELNEKLELIKKKKKYLKIYYENFDLISKLRKMDFSDKYVLESLSFLKKKTERFYNKLKMIDHLNSVISKNDENSIKAKILLKVFQESNVMVEDLCDELNTSRSNLLVVIYELLMLKVIEYDRVKDEIKF